MDVDLTVALGLEDPPPKFNFSRYKHESKDNESEVFGGKDYEPKGNKSVFLGEKEWLNGLNAVNLENEENDGSECESSEEELVRFETEPEGNKRKMEVQKQKDEVPVYEEEKVEHEFTVDEFELHKESEAKVVAANCRELEEKLKVGTEFPDLETVYLIYCEYARLKGFGVRKGEQRYFGRASSNIRWKEFICSATGLPNYRSAKHKLSLYKKLVTRSNCKAKLIVSREDMGSFVVSLFETEHNHELLTCDQSLMLRSSRHMSYAKKSVLEALHSTGIGVIAAFKSIAKESGGMQIVDRVKLQTRVEDADAKLLYEYFTNKSNSDPFFFWKYQLDDDGRLLNIFFRDTRCAVDYDAFGDVLSVDTTYRTKKYNLICAPFVGINHHTSNVMFGMGLMSDETTGSFKWLFEMFLKSMHGKQPKVIYTDHCRSMMNAIDVVFPDAKHRLCQWHIMKKCVSNFGKLNGDTKFKQLWYRCMNACETEEDFNSIWNDMMENYEIKNKSWYDGMYNLRERWASCFSRGIFTAGLLATSRSELRNKVLKNVVRSTDSLSIFVIHYEEIIRTWRTVERTEDTYGIWRPGQAISDNGLLMKAASVYTRNIYKIFEYDLANCITLIVDPKAVISLSDHNLQYTTKSRLSPFVEHKVVLNTVTHVASCDCGRWETEGLICQHILKVYVIENVDEIPDSMIFRRWTKRAKDLEILEDEIVAEESVAIRHMTLANQFMRHMSDMVSCAMQHQSLRPHLLKRMKQFDAEFRHLLSTYVDSQPAYKEVPIIVPLFRNHRKIGAPRGFENVGQPTSVTSRGRKREGTSSPARKSKRKPTTKKTQGAADDTDEENNFQG